MSRMSRMSHFFGGGTSATFVRRGLARFGMVWHGFSRMPPRHGAVWHGLARLGAVFLGAPRATMGMGGQARRETRRQGSMAGMSRQDFLDPAGGFVGDADAAGLGVLLDLTRL